MINTAVIGGEFPIDPELIKSKRVNGVYPTYSLGRTCLFSILIGLTNEINVLLCPDYICSSVTEVPDRLGLTVGHYHIESDYLPNTGSVEECVGGSAENKAILLVSYFGMVCLDDTIVYLRDKYPALKIIIDDVQNYFGFGDHAYYDYCFSSYRKWFSVPDGADIKQRDVSAKLPVYDEEAGYIQYKVAGNVLKNHSDILDESIALELLAKGESLMDESYLYKCSGIGSELINRLNLHEVADIRKKNAAFLHTHLEKMGVDHLYSSERIPLFIPISIPRRDQVRKHLFKEKIFSPVHWPLVEPKLQGNNTLYSTELSLICDQRYDEEDMERILKVLADAI